MHANNYKKDKKKKVKKQFDFFKNLYIQWISQTEKQQFPNDYNYKESSCIPTVAYLQHTPNNIKILKNNAFAVNKYFVSTFFIKDKNNDYFNIDDIFVILSLFTSNRKNTFVFQELNINSCSAEELLKAEQYSSILYNELKHLKPLKDFNKSITIDPRACVLTFRDFMKLNIKEPYKYYSLNISDIKLILNTLYKHNLLKYTDSDTICWDLYTLHIKSLDNKTSNFNNSNIKQTLHNFCSVYFKEYNIIRLDFIYTDLFNYSKKKKVPYITKTSYFLEKLKSFLFIPIIFFIIRFFIFFVDITESIIKINRCFYNKIKKLKYKWIYIVWKILTNILFYCVYYIIYKLMCIVNLFFFVLRWNTFKIFSYLRKLWIFIFFLFFGYVPILLLIFFIICLELYHLLNKLLRYKVYKENKYRLVFKIICFFNRLLVSKINTIKLKICNFCMKDLMRLINKLSNRKLK